MAHRHAIPQVSEYLSGGQADIIKLLLGGQAEANRSDRYLSWEKLRYHKAPEGLTLEEWWVGLKLNRLQGRRTIPATSTGGRQFSYVFNGLVQQALHRIDKQAGGTLYSDAQSPMSRAQGNFYLVSSLVEESIMSSVLEGASVTRAAAKSMIRAGRAPLDDHERMVLNNYHTMQQIKEWKDEPITPEKICALHRIMTQDTLPPEKAGALREAADNVRIENSISGEVVHIPPPADKLPERLQALCDFAMESDEENFTHPVLRAIIVHFWLAYDHPFVDGNGRTARALFYWMMLRHGFWLFEYVTISHQIYRNSKSYYTAFLDTEEDEGDLNYFITDQLQTILRAISTLYEYMARKESEQQKLLSGLHGSHRFNHRQKAVLISMLKNPDTAVTVAAHMREHGIVTQTARTDLAALVDAGLLTCTKQGKGFLYAPVPGLANKLRTL